MNSCDTCEHYRKIIRGFCIKERKLYFSDGCEKCGEPYDHETFWKDLMYDEEKECPEYQYRSWDDWDP